MPADSHHKFSAEEDDWGFAEFVKVSELKTARDEYMPDGKLHIQVKMRVKVEDKYTKMVRHVAGFVGRKHLVRTDPAPPIQQRAVEC